jgi:hypothetical protein
MATTFNVSEDRKFNVTEVAKSDPPPGESGDNWYCYTIDNGSAPISGIRTGSPASVRRYAEEFASNLNQRMLGFSPSARAPQKRQK